MVSYLYCIAIAGETVVMRGVLELIEIGWNANCIMPPERELPNSSYNHNTLITLRTPKGVILIALRGYNS